VGVERDLFGDLDLQPGRRDAARLQHAEHDVVDRQLRHLARRHVDGDRHVRQHRARGLELAHRPADLVDQVPQQRLGDAGVGGREDHFLGRDVAVTRMVPAHQRLEAVDVLAVAAHDRLVPDADGACLDGVEQVALHVPARAQPQIERGVEELVTVAPGALGLVERFVGEADHVGDVGVARHRDPDAHAQVAAVVRGGKRDRPDQRLGDGRGRLAGALQAVEHRELVAAPAAQHRAQVGELALQPAGHVLQHPVADLVAEGVVHRLEAIQVEQQQAVLLAAGRDDVQRRRLGEAFAVEQPGQGVMRGTERELLRRLQRQRMHLAQLLRHGGGLVAQPAALAEGPFAVQRAAHQRPEVQQHHRGQAHVVEAARIHQAACHGQQSRRDEADRHEREGRAVGHRARADAADHRQIEHRLGRRVAAAQQRNERPDQARDPGQRRRQPQVPLDRAPLGRGCHAAVQQHAARGRERPAADVAAHPVHRERQHQPAQPFERAARVERHQRRGEAQHDVDRNGREHAAAHHDQLVGPHHAREQLTIDGSGERGGRRTEIHGGGRVYRARTTVRFAKTLFA